MRRRYNVRNTKEKEKKEKGQEKSKKKMDSEKGDKQKPEEKKKADITLRDAWIKTNQRLLNDRSALVPDPGN